MMNVLGFACLLPLLAMADMDACSGNTCNGADNTELLQRFVVTDVSVDAGSNKQVKDDKNLANDEQDESLAQNGAAHSLDASSPSKPFPGGKLKKPFPGGTLKRSKFDKMFGTHVSPTGGTYYYIRCPGGGCYPGNIEDEWRMTCGKSTCGKGVPTCADDQCPGESGGLIRRLGVTSSMAETNGSVAMDKPLKKRRGKWTKGGKKKKGGKNNKGGNKARGKGKVCYNPDTPRMEHCEGCLCDSLAHCRDTSKNGQNGCNKDKCVRNCLVSMMCNHPCVCNDWKWQFCDFDYSLLSQRQDGFSTESNNHSGSDGSSLDASLKGKCA